MHTDSSLSLFQETTTKFGQLMRQFRDLSCSEFVTLELPRDIQARGQRPNVTQVQPRPQPLDAPILIGNGKGMAYPHGSGVGVHAGRGTGTAADTRGILNKPKNVPNGHVLAEILIK